MNWKSLPTFLVVLMCFGAYSVQAQNTYCTPKYSGNGYLNSGNPTAFFTHVLRVAIGNVDRQTNPPASANTTQIFVDYTGSDTVQLTQTASYPLTIELGNGANRQTVAVWIDYNQNQVFESTEMVWSRTDIENQGDHKYLVSLKVPKNAVLGHTRMRVGTIYGNDEADPCTNSRGQDFQQFIADWSQQFQDYSVNIVKPTIQTFRDVNVVHSTFDEIEPGTADNEVIRVDVTTNNDGLLSPLTVDSFYFNLLGNTNPANIKSVKLYYTGKNPTFNTFNVLDSLDNPKMDFTLTSQRELRQGTNYFWLAVEVDNNALLGNLIDARCNGIHVLTKRVPQVTAPSGSRRVGYCVSKGNRSMFVYPRWVRFGTISQFSGFTQTGYADYTWRSTQVRRGDTVALSVDVGNSVNNSFTKVWIDFNADGDFTDANELVLFDSITTANQTPTFGPVTANVWIPAGAKVGPTRMRVTSASKADQAPWKKPPEACDPSVEIGEVEDYTVVIAEDGEPVADFNATTVCLGDSTTFRDNSNTFSLYSINSWDWNFGDGNTSTDQNPRHLYQNAGIYKVRLVVNTNKPGTPDTIVKIVEVQDPEVDFTINTTLSQTPITFSDATFGGQVIYWEWNFGDPSSGTNQAFTPIAQHQYNSDGTYDVKLLIRTSGGCIDSVTKTIRVVDELSPIANFSAEDFEPYQQTPLQLQDLSVNRPSSWKWRISPATHNFVGNTTDTSQNPQVTLNALTTYTIWLKVENNAGVDSISRTFDTKAYQAPQADFSANQRVVKAGQIVSFLDESTNDPTQWEWVFGDGDTSVASNPVHEYRKTGNYTVSLDVENPAGSDDEIKNNYIQVSDEYVMCESDVTRSPLLKGTLYDAGGPNGNYGNNTNCGFLIQPNCAGTITLVFSDFGFLGNDVLRVYDGTNSNGKPLHPGSGFGGFTKPGVLRATSGAMYVVQVSDGFNDTTGFSASWTASNNVKPVAVLSGNKDGYVGSQALYSNNTKVGVSGSRAEWYLNDSLLAEGDNQLLLKFNQSGRDTLVLRVTNCAGSDTAMMVLNVKNTTQAPDAHFARVDTGRVFVLDEIGLQDLSDFGPSSWRWRISGGFADYLLVNGTSESDQNIELIFLNPGFYTVSLTATNSYGSDSLVRTRYILVEPQAALCSFPLNSSAPAGRLTDDGDVGFPYSSRSCDFLIDPCADRVILRFVEDSFDYAPGDFLRIYDGTDNTGTPLHTGNGFTFNNRPQGTYVANSGAIYVEHTSNGNPLEYGGFIADWNSIAFDDPEVDFSIPSVAYTGGNFVIFENLTDENDNPEVQYRWDFTNDGIYDDSTSVEPIHSFAQSGLTTVKLMVEACDFKDSITRTIRIRNPQAKPNADFSVSNLRPATTDLVDLQDLSTNGPNQYRWEISPNTYTIVEGSDTFPTMSVLFNEADTYSVKLVVANKLGVDSLLRDSHIIAIDYCDPDVTNSTERSMSIVYVGMGTINNRTDPATGNYHDYTATSSTNLTAGGKQPIIVQRGDLSPRGNLKVWIDFNQNGSFTDTLEEVLAIGSSSWSLLVDTVFVPRDALVGNTRMRVSVSLGNDANLPCGPKSFGEYEDYRVVIGSDKVKPVITLLGDSTEFIELGDTYNDPGAVAFDDLDGNITDSITTFSNVDTATAGIYQVTYRVKDGAGNEADPVTRRVVVLPDSTRPVITLYGPDTVFIDVYSSYTEPGYEANDSWDGDVTDLVVSNADNIIDTFRLDTFEIQYTVTDLNANEANAYRYVVVQDTIKPVITLNGPQVVEIVEQTPYVEDSATVSDNYWEDVILIISGFVDINKPDTYYVRYDAADYSGNTAVQRERMVVVTRDISVGEIDGLDAFEVYPNPAVEQLTIDISVQQNQDVELVMTNALGQVVYQTQSAVQNGMMRKPINVAHLQSGVYTIELRMNGQVTQRRFSIVR